MLSKVVNLFIFISLCFITLCIINLLFNKLLRKSNNINLKFLKSFIDVVLITIFIYSYLSQFDITKDISKTLMQSGTLLIAIATFAAQRVLSNVISGIAISSSKPFNIGDKIKVISTGGNIVSEGIVTDINLRHTIIKRYDGQCDIIPNSIIDESIISNTNLIENVGNFIEVEISYDSDLDLACDLMKSIIVNNDLTINNDENTSIVIKDLSQNGVILRALVISRSLDDSFKSCSNIRKEILKRFKSRGIVIPYQTITINN